MKQYVILIVFSLLVLSCAGKHSEVYRFDLAPVSANDFQAHCDSMYVHAAMRYDFDRYRPAQFKRWQKRFRAELKETLGIAMMEEQMAGYHPESRLVEEFETDYAIVQRWEIWTEPTVILPFVVLRPKDAGSEPRPLVIAPHGHGKNPESYAGLYKDAADSLNTVKGDRNIGVQAVQRGYYAICPTSRGFGSTRSAAALKRDYYRSCSELMQNDILVGRTVVGDRVWDISRLIDWAYENIPLDRKNVIVTGNSGGGTTTLFAGAVDERISISVPGSCLCTFAGSIGAMDHCKCNYVPGIMNLGDMGDIAGLTAPRPFCEVHGVLDDIFPIECTRETFARTSRIYKAAGAPDACELFEGPEGHRYYKDGAWDFIERHLR